MLGGVCQVLPTQQEGPLGWCWQSIRGVCGISGLPEFLPQHLGWFVRNVGLFWVSVGTARVVSVKEIHSIRLETLSEAGLLSNLWLRHSSAANRAARAALLELVAPGPAGEMSALGMCQPAVCVLFIQCGSRAALCLQGWG